VIPRGTIFGRRWAIRSRAARPTTSSVALPGAAGSITVISAKCSSTKVRYRTRLRIGRTDLDRSREVMHREVARPMPRYFFHFTNERTLRDDEGEDLPDLTAAKAHAVRIAAELVSEPESHAFAVLITDEHGTELGSVPIRRTIH